MVTTIRRCAIFPVVGFVKLEQKVPQVTLLDEFEKLFTNNNHSKSSSLVGV
jgi:hypothetical protein